ncbi:sugar phosphate isomerase/epimerase family protein [Flavivirga eckloniae]|uniref:Xylose isomerase n=1 Tax=Flavivirga eckloniae TaxID=1803846 RepID=A0A2K9PSJ2_9FLAO|nr:sugar phosphate isomerase/epimerase family protein [Flavivirga eckloniae]AUP80031.1 xylose isomerase [Flavivirga eckloniae]
MKRRDFVIKTTCGGAALSLLGLHACKKSEKKEAPSNQEASSSNPLFFKLSLAQWSLHNALFGNEMNHLDFAAKSRSFGLEGLEYVNSFFKDKAKDMSFLKEMNLRADSEGQQNVLIMIDGEGSLANSDETHRLKAIENHYKWVEAAQFLGCHAIRVNLAGGVDKNEAAKVSVDSLNRLSDFAKEANINVLVENHGGFSSNGKWMVDVFSKVANKNCGTLPDFGNFCITKNEDGSCVDEYDRYQGIKELLPYAKAVSAKSYDFNEKGEDKIIDYRKMMQMVKDSGYRGFVGIEYEGKVVPEAKGIELTRDLLVRIGKQLS